LSGYNWRNTLGDATSVSGVLAGFAVAFAGLVLQSQRDLTLATMTCASATFVIYSNSVGLLLSGMSAVFFVSSLEFSLTARSHDVWALPSEYEESLKKGYEAKGLKWSVTRDEQDRLCRKYCNRSRLFYNIGIFLIFLALGFTILPYSLVVGMTTSAIGFIFEIVQMLTFRHQSPPVQRASR